MPPAAVFASADGCGDAPSACCCGADGADCGCGGGCCGSGDETPEALATPPGGRIVCNCGQSREIPAAPAGPRVDAPTPLTGVVSQTVEISVGPAVTRLSRPLAEAPADACALTSVYRL